MPTWYEDRGDFDGLASLIDGRRKWLEAKDTDGADTEPTGNEPPSQPVDSQGGDAPPASPPGAPSLDVDHILNTAREKAGESYAKLETYAQSLSEDAKAVLRPEWKKLKETAEKADLGPIGV